MLRVADAVTLPTSNAQRVRCVVDDADIWKERARARTHSHTLACRVSEALMTFIRMPIRTGACGHLRRACWQFPPQTNYAHVKVPSRLPPRLSCPQIRSPALSSRPPPPCWVLMKKGPQRSHAVAAICPRRCATSDFIFMPRSNCTYPWPRGPFGALGPVCVHAQLYSFGSCLKLALMSALIGTAVHRRWTKVSFDVISQPQTCFIIGYGSF